MIASGVSARVFKAVYQGATVAVKVMDNPEIEQEILLSRYPVSAERRILTFFPQLAATPELDRICGCRYYQQTCSHDH